MFSQVLSNKQKEVLEFLKKYLEENDQSPTISEIGLAVRLSSKASVHETLAALEKRGYVRRVAGAYRGIVLTEEDEGSVELPVVEIPLKGSVAAGQPIETFEENETIKVPKKLIPKPNRQYFALEVKGDSMSEDGIYNGEIVIVEAQNTAQNGDLVVARDNKGGVTLKYFYKEANRIRLEPRNSQYQPIYLDDCEILGLFKGVTQVL